MRWLIVAMSLMLVSAPASAADLTAPPAVPVLPSEVTVPPEVPALPAEVTAPAEVPASPDDRPPPAAAPDPAPDLVVPAGIDPTGQQDVTRALQDFLDAACDQGGGNVVFPPDARYRVEGTLELVDCHDLSIAGNGATVFATTPGTRTRSHWRMRGGANLAIHGIVVEGANPFAGTGDRAYRKGLEAQHGFEALAVDGLWLEGVTVTDVYGDFVYLGGERRRQPDGSTRLVWSTDVTVRGSAFLRNGRQGIAITAAERVLIEGNEIGETRRATFDIEPNSSSGGARDIRIVGNRVGAGRLLFLAMGGAGGRIDGVEVVGNTLTRSLTVTVVAGDGGRRANLVIADNVAYGPHISQSAAMRFWDVDGLVVTGNRAQFRANKETTAVQVRRSCAVLVEGNNFINAGRDLDHRRWSC